MSTKSNSLGMAIRSTNRNRYISSAWPSIMTIKRSRLEIFIALSIVLLTMAVIWLLVLRKNSEAESHETVLDPQIIPDKKKPYDGPLVFTGDSEEPFEGEKASNWPIKKTFIVGFSSNSHVLKQLKALDIDAEEVILRGPKDAGELSSVSDVRIKAHSKIWQEIDEGPVFILEEGVQIDRDLRSIVNTSLEALRMNNNWAVLGIGYCSAANCVPYRGEADVLGTVNFFTCFHAYIVRDKESARTLSAQISVDVKNKLTGKDFAIELRSTKGADIFIYIPNDAVAVSNDHNLNGMPKIIRSLPHNI